MLVMRVSRSRRQKRSSAKSNSMTHESSADDESDALSGFGSEVDNFLHNVTDYYRLVPSHQAQVCPLFLLVSFALSKKIIDFPGGQRSNKHTVKNSWPRPWLCLFNTHFFAIIFDCKKLTWLIWDSDQTWPISMGWSEKVSCPSMPCPINDTLLSLELQLREEEGEEGAMRMTDTPPIMKMKLMSMTKKTPIILGHWCCQSAWFANLLSPPSPIWILTHTRPSILKKPMFAFCTNHIQF